jgi:hypothetical protein
MLPQTKRRNLEPAPSKIGGIIYIWIGFVALILAGFVEFVEGKFGPVTNFRISLGIVIALWGLYRIYTGISTIRKVSRENQSVILPGNDAGREGLNPPVQ